MIVVTPKVSTVITVPQYVAAIVTVSSPQVVNVYTGAPERVTVS